MKHPMVEGQIILDVTEAVLAFLMGLIARISLPLVVLGLIYWAATSVAGISPNVIPWWGVSWAILQSVAIETHFVTLLPVAYVQAKRGEHVNLAVTVIVLVLLAASSFTMLLGLHDHNVIMLRTLALVSVLCTEPAQLMRNPFFVVGIPIVALQYAPEKAQEREQPHEESL